MNPTLIAPSKLPKTINQIPDAWKKAAGLLKHKKIDPLKYQRKVRKGWEERLRRQIKLGTNGL